MNEFGYLKNLKKHFNLDLIGDDCAVLPVPGGPDLLVTSDMLVEDVDFRLRWASPEDLGHKSLAVSLSDIAAMGGDAKYMMLSLGVPRHLWQTGFLDQFYNGVARLAKEARVEIAGGDISESPHGLVIDSVGIGSCEPGKAVLRSGAKPGDMIFVSGPLGASAVGLAILESQRVPADEFGDEFHAAVAKHLRPIPQLTLAKQLMLGGLATALIDISDGLSSDLKHICEASGTGAVLKSELIPIHPSAHKVPREDLPELADPLSLALHGGEEFELLFTADPGDLERIEGLSCVRIGTVTDTPDQFEISLGRESRKIEASGFEHFREPLV